MSHIPTITEEQKRRIDATFETRYQVYVEMVNREKERFRKTLGNKNYQGNLLRRSEPLDLDPKA